MNTKHLPGTDSSAVGSPTEAAPEAEMPIGARVRGRRGGVRKVLLTCFAGIMLFGVAGSVSCGVADNVEGSSRSVTSTDVTSPSNLTAESIRQYALAALRDGEGWEVVVKGGDGYLTVDWWSADSRYYRWDDTAGGVTTSSATDGAALFLPSDDGTVTSQALVADSSYPPNPTEFTAYYWYLADGKPLEVESGGSRNHLAVKLIDAPSGLTAVLDSKTFLPKTFKSAGSFTGDTVTHRVRMTAISLDEVKDAVAEVQARMSPAN